MTTYTDEEARRQFEAVLNTARNQGEVRIKTEDGQEYALKPVSSAISPFDIPGVNLQLTTAEIIGFVRESRER